MNFDELINEYASLTNIYHNVPYLADNAHTVNVRTLTVKSQWTVDDVHRGCIIKPSNDAIIVWWQRGIGDLHEYTVTQFERKMTNIKTVRKLASTVTAKEHVNAVALAMHMVVVDAKRDYCQLLTMADKTSAALGVDVFPVIGEVNGITVRKLPHAYAVLEYRPVDHVLIHNNQVMNSDSREAAYVHQVLAGNIPLTDSENWRVSTMIGHDLMVLHRRCSRIRWEKVYAVRVNDKLCAVYHDVMPMLYAECEHAEATYTEAVQNLSGDIQSER